MLNNAKCRSGSSTLKSVWLHAFSMTASVQTVQNTQRKVKEPVWVQICVSRMSRKRQFQVQMSGKVSSEIKSLVLLGQPVIWKILQKPTHRIGLLCWRIIMKLWERMMKLHVLLKVCEYTLYQSADYWKLKKVMPFSQIYVLLFFWC